MDDFFKDLNKEQITILKQQIERFENFRKKIILPIIPKNIPIFPKGTLIHGTEFNIEKLGNIALSGIITGQYFGIEEDGETFFCADFHRVDKDITIKDYNDNFSYIDGRCPFGTRGKNTIAFIIHPNEELREIINYDCYKDNTPEAAQTKKFVNEKGLPIDNKDKASSILFGIPSNFINGIVVGDNIISKENIRRIRNIFPNCYIVRNNGEIIHKQNDLEGIANLRIDAIQEKIISDKKDKEIKSLNEKIKTMKKNEEKLWNAISELPLEQIVKIYELIGWQGNSLKYANTLKENNKKGGKSK